MPAPCATVGTEDFSYVLQKVPGSYLYVGACPPGTERLGLAAVRRPPALADLPTR